MLTVEHSGYSFERGWFRDEYSIDPDKTDYEIRFPDGDIYRQKSEFHKRTADWNYDGDIYEQFGAFFEIESLGRNEFLTPVEMVELIKEHHCTIPGVSLTTVFGKPGSMKENDFEKITNQADSDNKQTIPYKGMER